MTDEHGSTGTTSWYQHELAAERDYIAKLYLGLTRLRTGAPTSFTTREGFITADASGPKHLQMRLTRSKLEAIREIGVTRLSLGIENADDIIADFNQAIARMHLPD